jgi:hypothetical protein
VRAYSRNRAGNAIGVGHRIVNGVSQLPEQVFQVIVELQGGISPTLLPF